MFSIYQRPDYKNELNVCRQFTQGKSKSASRGQAKLTSFFTRGAQPREASPLTPSTSAAAASDKQQQCRDTATVATIVGDDSNDKKKQQQQSLADEESDDESSSEDEELPNGAVKTRKRIILMDGGSRGGRGHGLTQMIILGRNKDGQTFARRSSYNIPSTIFIWVVVETWTANWRPTVFFSLVLTCCLKIKTVINIVT